MALCWGLSATVLHWVRWAVADWNLFLFWCERIVTCSALRDLRPKMWLKVPDATLPLAKESVAFSWYVSGNCADCAPSMAFFFLFWEVCWESYCTVLVFIEASHRVTRTNTLWCMTELSTPVLRSFCMFCMFSHWQVKIELLLHNRSGNKAQVSDSLSASLSWFFLNSNVLLKNRMFQRVWAKW